MKYLLDESLSPRLLDGAQVAGVPVPFLHLRELFSPGTDPAVWIPEIRGRDYIVLSLATGIADFHRHRQDLLRYSTTIFSLPKSRFGAPGVQQRARVDQHFHRVHASATALCQSAGVKVVADGECTTLWTV